MKLFRGTLTGFLIVLIAGCGWTLSKPQSLPSSLRVIHIDDTLSNTLTSLLTDELSRRGSLIVPASEDALTRIVSGNIDIEQRDLTVDRFGKTQEYNLQAVACISIEHGTFPKRQFCTQARARLDNDTSRVLATQLERDQRRQQLRHTVVQQLVNQLAAMDKQP